MNQFVVSARKYRPSTFDTVVGQQHITHTLQNALKNNHLTQAYLFCGPRGVGKTTCARILAKTLNCINLTADFEACNECEFCQMINSGQSFNMQELDAASNNGVDEMRALVEQVRYAPQSGKYKIYIIDEVHMLSTAAFNAFLKTLEEPPPYAIFILATTEKHKILPTILSRCQIFDFNRITIDDIAHQLTYIAGKEGITADAEGLHIIAQKADGAMRDALSMFDQIVSFAGNTVTYKDVLSNLNVLDYEYYFKITDLMTKGDYASILLVFDELLNEGFDGHHFVTGMSGHLRDLMVCKDAATLKLLTVSSGVKERYRAQAEASDGEWLMALLDIFNRCDIEYKTSKNQRLHVELTLMKACRVKKKFPELTEDFFEIVYEDLVNTSGDVVLAPRPILQTQAQNSVAEPPPKPISTPTPPQTPPIKIPAGVRMIPSIRNLGVKAPPSELGEAAEVATGASKNKPFDIAELHKQVKIFADTKIDTGARNLYFTLCNHLPQLSGNRIVFLVDNNNQQDLVNDVKVSLLGYLKDALQNDYITIDTSVSETPTHGKVAYTGEEKFKEMESKNPELKRLRKLFDLDI